MAEEKAREQFEHAGHKQRKESLYHYRAQAMKTYVKAGLDGRIETIRQLRRTLGPEWTEVSYRPDLQDYRLVDGQLVYDPLPARVEPDKTVDQKRREAYPSVGEQLDAIVKSLRYMEDNGVDTGSAARKLVRVIRDVKVRFPKETE